MIERDRIDSIIEEKKLKPLLNNKKWVKILKLFILNFSNVESCKVKLVWESEYKGRYLVFDENTSYGLDFYAKSMESMITGNPKGWYDYKEIEYLEFPKIVESVDKKNNVLIKVQEIEKISEIISQIGEIEMELNENYLRIFGYY